MPPKHKHLYQARKNERFIDDLNIQTTPYLDWVITATFYAALHYVEAYFASKGKHCPNRIKRQEEIDNDNQINNIYASYRKLETESRHARYHCVVFHLQTVEQLRSNHFLPIKQHIKSLI